MIEEKNNNEETFDEFIFEGEKCKIKIRSKCHLHELLKELINSGILNKNDVYMKTGRGVLG